MRETEANEYIEKYFRRTYNDTRVIIRANNDFFGNFQDVRVVNVLGTHYYIAPMERKAVGIYRAKGLLRKES